MSFASGLRRNLERNVCKWSLVYTKNLSKLHITTDNLLLLCSIEVCHNGLRMINILRIDIHDKYIIIALWEKIACRCFNLLYGNSTKRINYLTLCVGIELIALNKILLLGNLYIVKIDVTILIGLNSPCTLWLLWEIAYILVMTLVIRNLELCACKGSTASSLLLTSIFINLHYMERVCGVLCAILYISVCGLLNLNGYLLNLGCDCISLWCFSFLDVVITPLKIL